MDIRLIATDLDGTALTEDSVTLSPRLTRALEEAARRGIVVAVATGRQYKMLPPCVPGAPWAGYAILCNGSELRALPGGELLESHYLPAEDIAPLLDCFRTLGIPCELSGNGRLHTSEDMLRDILATPVSDFHRDVLARRGVIVPALEPYVAQSPYPFDKINLPYIPTEKYAALDEAMAQLSCSAVSSGPHIMEITHHDATKGKALLSLCARLGIDREQSFAIGDSGNDVSMLRDAGFSVAMGSAPDFVKACADAVTLPNTGDGAALAIERYVLGL